MKVLPCSIKSVMAHSYRQVTYWVFQSRSDENALNQLWAEVCKVLRNEIQELNEVIYVYKAYCIQYVSQSPGFILL